MPGWNYPPHRPRPYHDPRDNPFRDAKLMGYKQAHDLVNSPKWRGWQQGMVATNSNGSGQYHPFTMDSERLPDGLVPDHRHPATQGWLWAWLQEMDRYVIPVNMGGKVVIRSGERVLAEAETYGLALVFAMLAALRRVPTSPGYWWMQMEPNSQWTPLYVWQEGKDWFWRDPEGAPVKLSELPPTVLWGPQVKEP